MYLTLNEVANKYKLSPVETTQFCQLVVTDHSSKIVTNPDISATGFDALMVDYRVMYGIMSEFLESGSGYTIPTVAANKSLRKDAVEAMATFLASQNFTGSFDFNMDMRVEDNDSQIDPAIFLTEDLDCTKDQMSDLDEDIHTLMGVIQKEIATRNKH